MLVSEHQSPSFSTPDNAARHLQRPAVSKRLSQKQQTLEDSQSALIALL